MTTDDPRPDERLREAIHASFVRWRGACEHFDKGFGLYRQCDDEGADIAIRELPGIIAALAADPAPGLDDIEHGARQAVGANGEHYFLAADVRRILRSVSKPADAKPAGDEPDPNRTGMPKCPRCGDIAYRPEPMGTRQSAWRCGGCHRTLSRCTCPADAKPAMTEDEFVAHARSVAWREAAPELWRGSRPAGGSGDD